MELQVVSSYKKLLSRVADIIEVSGYRNDYIAKKLGLKPQNFSAKKQKGNWSPDELEKLLTVVDNEDVENYLMLEHMRSLKDAETISYEEYKKEIATWK
jgi:hypothetical protein